MPSLADFLRERGITLPPTMVHPNQKNSTHGHADPEKHLQGFFNQTFIAQYLRNIRPAKLR